MSGIYTKTFLIRWADLDPNGHMRHSAYADYGAETRIGFLSEYGFGLAQFMKSRIGPILFREDLRYFREIHAHETIKVTCEATGMSPNRKHWRIRHRIFRQDGELSCSIDCQGAWLDLVQRKVVPAPAELQAVMEKMPRADDYAEFEAPRSGS